MVSGMTRADEGRGRLRLGAVPYLNVAPMICGLESDGHFDLVRDRPARLAERLRDGELDLAILPAAEYRDDAHAIVPGMAIGSRGEVRSVRFLHRVPIERVRRVALDWSSRSSAALLRLILRERLGRDPEYVERPPVLAEMLDDADGALLIGDAALFAPADVPALDLGAEWTRLTGKPFVYAFWAGPPGRLTPTDVARLAAALCAGLAAIPAVSEAHLRATGDGAPGTARQQVAEAYLRECVHYRLDAGAIAGLEEFYRRAAGLGLVERVPELRFYAAQ